MRKRFVSVITILVILTAGFVGVSYGKPLAPTIRIGVLTNSTGPLYFAGAIQKTASALAGEDLYDASVKTLFFYEDVGNTVADAKTAFKKLRANDVDVVIGPLTSASTVAVLKADERDPLPIIAPSPIDQNVDGSLADVNWLFRMATTNDQDNYALVDLIARDKRPNIALVAGTDPYSMQSRLALARGLVFRGYSDVHGYSVTEQKALRLTKPDVLVLTTLEESVSFMNVMSDWVSPIKNVYLVQGNLANYSMYSWAGSLNGAQAVAPADSFPGGFKTRLLTALNKPYLLNSTNQSVFTLGKRIYDSVLAAGRVFKSGDSHEIYRKRLAQAKSEGQSLFSADGLYLMQKYTIFRYGSSGLFSPVAVFDPNSP
jgi:hypothetical protein